jgi:hypothetical protein
MFFAWLHKKISLKASIVAICASVVLTVISLQVCFSLGEPSEDGDTPEICRLYLEQNGFVHDHFGKLREESFVKDKSMATIQPPNPETIGLYTFKVSGTKAKGTLELLWAREVENGALTVTAIRITEESPYSQPLTSHGLKEAAPQYSGLPDGPLATVSALHGSGNQVRIGRIDSYRRRIELGYKFLPLNNLFQGRSVGL